MRYLRICQIWRQVSSLLRHHFPGSHNLCPTSLCRTHFCYRQKQDQQILPQSPSPRTCYYSLGHSWFNRQTWYPPFPFYCL